MPPTRGHQKLALYFLLLALALAWVAVQWMEQASEPSGALVRLEDARRIAVTLIALTALLGFGGVLLRRIFVASARAREQAMWAEKVQAESHKYRALFEGSADMLLIVDPRTLAIREGNSPSRAELGPVVGLEDLLGAAQRTTLAEELRACAAAPGQTRTLTDLDLRASGARTLVADAHLAHISIAGEALVLVALHDRTRQRAMERELAMRERLSAIGLFTAGVAHEINNPLEAMGNYLTLLEKEELPPQTRQRYLGLVQHGFGRIRDLVRDLLRFARPEEAHASVRVDLARIVANASQLVALSASLKDVAIATQGLERPLWLAGDAGRLEQVLVNLLLNAGKAQQGRGRITLRARELSAEGLVELAVEDEGPGIPPENLARLFDPFFGAGEGTGLGLAVSWGIVRAHGGTIAVENRTEGGARFVLRLPRNPGESAA
ncbi:MAG: hypothetical protein IPJ19_04245 [Planctomycetes bacterium]|nr:hypothetical protein [Planctomycetota bacterium]